MFSGKSCGLFVSLFVFGFLSLLNCGNRSSVGLTEVISPNSCDAWRQSWPAVIKKARSLPPRSGARFRLLSESLAQQSSVCELAIEELFRLLEEIKSFAPEFTARVGQHGQIVPFLSNRLRMQRSDMDLEVVAYPKLVQWMFDATREESRHRRCGSVESLNLGDLPEARCRATWLYDVLVKNERVAFDTLSSEATRRLLRTTVTAELREIKSWPSAWSAAWPKGWPEMARALLQQRSVEDLTTLFSENATALLPIFVGGLSSKQGSLCLKSLAMLRAFNSAESAARTDENALRLFAAVAAQVCPTDRFTQARVAEARAAVVETYHYQGMSSPYSDVELLQYVNDALNDDLALRSDLGLHFGYGLEEDQRELKANPKLLRAYVIDSVVMNYLRRIGTLPWVRVLSDIDNRSRQIDFLADLLLRLGTDSSAGGRFLQFALLGVGDVVDDSDGTGVSSEALVRQIREESTTLASQIPQMRAVTYEIHNGLHAGLSASVLGVIGSLSSVQREQFERPLRGLAEKIETYFRRHASSSDHARGLIGALGSANPELQQRLLALLDRMDTEKELRLSLWLRMSDAVFSEILCVEKVAGSDNGQRQKGFEGHSRALHYLRLLRIAAEVNSGVALELGAPNVNEDVVVQQLYLRHLVSYTGIAGVHGRSLEEALGNVSESLQRLFRPRLARFEWFLWMQSHRDVKSPNYALSIAYRRAALPFAVEKLFRDVGLHLAAKLVPAPANLSWRAMNHGVAYGLLSVVEKEALPQHAYRRNEILLTNGMPLNLGVTAGVITELFQPRASHIDLRTRERGTPNAFVRDARIRWGHLAGKFVRLEVSAEGVTVVEAKASDVQVARGDAQASVQVPALTVDDAVVIDVDANESETAIGRVGAKAFGYAHLRRIFGKNGPVAPALSIPFKPYLETVRSSPIAGLVAELLAKKHRLDEEQIAEQLKAIRAAIKAMAQSDALLQSAWYATLRTELETLATATVAEGHGSGWNRDAACFRFRSSTNAEDLVNFQGAGLYESKTGCLHPERLADAKRKSMAEAITDVWASLWTQRAFAEREYCGIDHQRVAMAILVHRNWDDESANGVLLTRSLVDSSVLISVQPGENLVTNPDGSLSGAEVVATLMDGRVAVVSRTGGTSGEALLSDMEVGEVLRAAERIHSDFVAMFASSPQLPTLRFDVEFKFIPGETQNSGRKLILKQARPSGG